MLDECDPWACFNMNFFLKRKRFPHPATTIASASVSTQTWWLFLEKRSRPPGLVVSLMSVLVVLGLISGMSVAQAQPPEDTKNFSQAFESAMAAVQSGDYEQALALWQALKKDHPDHLEVRNNLAATYMALEQYDQAQKLLEATLAEIPQIERLRANLTALHAFQAQNAYQKVFDTQPKPPEPQWAMAAQATLKTNPQWADARKKKLQTVVNLTEQWRGAWAAQSVSAYTDWYQANYAPPDQTDHASWMQNRQASLTRPKFIDITLTDIEAVALGSNTMQVTFTQAYRSDFYQDKVKKKLVWRQNEKDQWRIAVEEVLYEIQ